MANWADVEFRKTTRHRRVHDVLSLAADILMLWDFLMALACGQAAHALWHAQFLRDDAAGSGSATFLPEVVVGSLVLSLALRSDSVMKRNLPRPLPSFISGAQRRVPHMCAAFVAVAFFTQMRHPAAQTWIVTWFIMFTPVIGGTRWALDLTLGRLERSGAFREAVAIVGRSGARDRLATRIAAKADIVGFCETPLDRSGFLPDDEIEKLQELGAGGCVDSIVLAFEEEHGEIDVSQLIERLKMLPLQVAICLDTECPSFNAAEFRLLGGVPIKIVSDRPINRRDLLIKTILDKTIALMLLTLLSPFMALIAIGIKTTSKGPVIFRQPREGWCGKQFTVFKFRTMRGAPPAGRRTTQTRRKDPRCTRFGRFLRSTSLDELPQLWNVLRGDMSLIGPRPHADMLDDAELIGGGREIIAEYVERFRVKPGMTGWAQIHGARGAITTVEQLRHRVAMDLFYIEHWSLWLDLKILFHTPLCMMGKNVF